MHPFTDAHLIEALVEIHRYGDIPPQADAETDDHLRFILEKLGMAAYSILADRYVLTPFGIARAGSSLRERASPPQRAVVLQFPRRAKDRSKALTNQRASPDRQAKPAEQEVLENEKDAKA